MFKPFLLLTLALSTVSVVAQEGHVLIWPNGVPPAGNGHTPINLGNHALSISHREVSGHVEIHLDKSDVMVIQSGSATLLYGGEAVDPKPTARPNELAAATIRNGERREVKTGDVIHVPRGVPHQFLLAPGTQITYLLVKIIDPPKGQ